ncbi:4Fe-4S binding protein [Desulfofustis limnaeus]|uniref:(4Fe-4S)-binding protein n=1 Tax=Desulfofustis limnaeus TaxID=2740163 RepID=A0ABM7W590_9BACT|nr:4Fe-4S dicluster domain-containing protein [Desulfofustis limnaeus]BDD86020.1 (4Fe-4S)-binding protein [Desulfofustis limnaeus]
MSKLARFLVMSLALLTIAAHNLRHGDTGAMLFWLLGAGLMMSRCSWKWWALAGLFGFGAALWASVTLDLVQQRMMLHQPWLRLAAILGTVTLLCLIAASSTLWQAWHQRTLETTAPGIAYLLTVAGLALAKTISPVDVLLADRFLPGSGWVVIFGLGLYAAWITGKMLDARATARWRRLIWSLFSVVFFSQLVLGLAGLEKLLMTGSLHLPVPALIAAGPLFRGDGLFMVVLFATAVALAGPAWCSHLCYVGAWDNLAATVHKQSTPLPGWTKVMRWLLCLAVLGLALILGRSGFPASQAVLLAAAFGLVGVGLMLSWSRRSGTMTHCLTYCPMGLLANLFGRVNPWRITVGPGCTGCGKCTSICRYDALRPVDLQKQRAGFTCSLCGDCIGSCPHGRLQYHFPRLSSGTARAVFLTVVISLHALFLGVARL